MESTSANTEININRILNAEENLICDQLNTLYPKVNPKALISLVRVCGTNLGFLDAFTAVKRETMLCAIPMIKNGRVFISLDDAIAAYSKCDPCFAMIAFAELGVFAIINESQYDTFLHVYKNNMYTGTCVDTCSHDYLMQIVPADQPQKLVFMAQLENVDEITRITREITRRQVTTTKYKKFSVVTVETLCKDYTAAQQLYDMLHRAFIRADIEGCTWMGHTLKARCGIIYNEYVLGSIHALSSFADVIKTFCLGYETIGSVSERDALVRALEINTHIACVNIERSYELDAITHNIGLANNNSNAANAKTLRNNQSILDEMVINLAELGKKILMSDISDIPSADVNDTQILRHTADRVDTTTNFSKIAICWLNDVAAAENIYIRHALNHGEYKIPGTQWKADGYCKATNTIYEFHGDYWHGNPAKYPADEINPTTKTKYGDLFARTVNRENDLRKLGYNVVSIWESDYVPTRRVNNGKKKASTGKKNCLVRCSRLPRPARCAAGGYITYAKTCIVCGTESQCIRCSECNITYYCSKTCQHKHSLKHKMECFRMSAAMIDNPDNVALHEAVDAKMFEKTCFLEKSREICQLSRYDDSCYWLCKGISGMVIMRPISASIESGAPAADVGAWTVLENYIRKSYSIMRNTAVFICDLSALHWTFIPNRFYNIVRDICGLDWRRGSSTTKT